jgi:hypothetical protein
LETLADSKTASDDFETAQKREIELNHKKVQLAQELATKRKQLGQSQALLRIIKPL